VHHHSALGLMPPAVVHYGQAEQVRQQREHVLRAAYDAHPERFANGSPKLQPLPSAVWINKPNQTILTSASGDGRGDDEVIIVTPSKPPGDTQDELERVLK